MFDQVKQALYESSMRVVTGLARLLPGFVALIVAVLVSSLVAMLLAWLLRRFLRGIQFDGKLAGLGLSGLTDVSPARSPTMLVVGFVRWCVILAGALIGVAAFDAAITQQMVMRLFT